MPANLMNKATIKELAAKAAGLDNDQGDPRLKEVFNRLLQRSRVRSTSPVLRW
jgi:hypothetical protein